MLRNGESVRSAPRFESCRIQSDPLSATVPKPANTPLLALRYPQRRSCYLQQPVLPAAASVAARHGDVGHEDPVSQLLKNELEIVNADPMQNSLETIADKCGLKLECFYEEGPR